MGLYDPSSYDIFSHGFWMFLVNGAAVVVCIHIVLLVWNLFSVQLKIPAIAGSNDSITPKLYMVHKVVITPKWLPAIFKKLIHIYKQNWSMAGMWTNLCGEWLNLSHAHQADFFPAFIAGARGLGTSFQVAKHVPIWEPMGFCYVQYPSICNLGTRCWLVMLC